MRLNKLILRNFGLYKGEHIIDLVPRTKWGRERPIILIGGENGAGKTTILEAVQLCLYGRLVLGSRVGDSQYHSYLRERIHWSRSVLIPINYASVGVEFDYAHAGRRSRYFVHRSWQTRGSTAVEERLRVDRDGQALAEIESQFWPEFIRSLVPPGVSQLFFFDGEKIKRLADEESEASTVAESVKGLLGLHLVEQLRADLDLYAARHLKKTATRENTNKLAHIETSVRDLQYQLDKARSDEADLTDRLKSLAIHIDLTEEQLAQRGEGLLARRGVLQDRKNELVIQRDNCERKLRELCDGPLVFAACPTMVRALLEQLEVESNQERRDAARGHVDEVFACVTHRLTEGEVPERLNLDECRRAEIAREIIAVREEFFPVSAQADQVPIIHSVSDRQRRQIRATMDEATGPARNRASELSFNLARLESELRDLQERMNRAPQRDEISSVIAELSDLQQAHAKLSLELTLTRERLEKLERELLTLRRERERLLKAEASTRALVDRLSLAVKSRKALDEYLSRLTSVKIQEFATIALECFRGLCGKSDLIARIHIDSRTFRVTLFDNIGREVPRTSLSAGEKQIYAVSLLCGLAKASGRPLPMIIDTPLGRLDRRHRVNLLEKYLPWASHQVVILSTDTEVDRQNFEILKTHTSHCIRLSSDEGHSNISPGYFWQESDDVGA